MDVINIINRLLPVFNEAWTFLVNILELNYIKTLCFSPEVFCDGTKMNVIDTKRRRVLGPNKLLRMKDKDEGKVSGFSGKSHRAREQKSSILYAILQSHPVS